MYAPRNVSGTEIRNHSKMSTTIVPNGMAADDPRYHNIRLMTKNMEKMTPGSPKADSNTLVFHSSPWNILYRRELT